MKSEKYKKSISLMASSYDLYGEIPSMYSNEFQEAVCERLLKDESGVQYTHYKYLPLFERDYKFPEILKLLTLYIKANGDPDDEKRIALKVCETLVKNITLYFREDIEDDIQQEYHKKYDISNNTIYSGHTDYVEI